MIGKFYLFLFGLFLTGGCQPAYRVAWVGPGAVAQVRYQCIRETGGSESKPSPMAMTGSALGSNTQGKLAYEYQLRKHELFMACMKSKGYTRQRVPY